MLSDDPLFNNQFVNFVSNNFEVLFYVTFALLVLLIATFVAIWVRDISLWVFFKSTIKRVLYVMLISGQLVLFLTLGIFYWNNYRTPVLELVLPLDVKSSTNWVRDNLRIYFVDDTKFRSVRINGQDKEDLLVASAPIIEYRFSPDGKYILVLSQNELFLINRKTHDFKIIDAVKSSKENSGSSIKGSIAGIQWSPDSQNFVYEIARWSKFSNQDTVYVYSLKDKSKRSIKSPTRRKSSLYWAPECYCE